METIKNINNKKIVDEFNLLIKQIMTDIDNSQSRTEEKSNLYRLNSIRKSLNIIRNYPKIIIHGEQLKDIKGIGKGTINRINEILEKGKLSEIKKVHVLETITNYVNELKQVYGIGEKMAFNLVKNYNIKSINELKNAYYSGKIKLSNTIVIGLKYVDIYKKSIPRSEMDKINVYLQHIIHKMNPNLIGIMCGSYRRNSQTSNDIDFLLLHKQIKTKREILTSFNYLELFINNLIKKKFIVDSLTGTDVMQKYMGFCKLNKYPVRRIDIVYLPYDSYYTALLYFTGPGEFNQHIRLLAKKKGYILNQYGLYKIINNKKKN